MNDTIESSNHNKVLVLGNGFDLDLGWNTRFLDFAKSEFCPKNSYIGSIIEFLNRHKNYTNWFDIEDLIGLYASSYKHSQQLIEINKGLYHSVVDGFKNYLKRGLE